MKRIQGLLTGLAVGLLFCACGAGDEETTSGDNPAASEDRASEQVESTEPTGDLDGYGQTQEALSCRNACTVVSNTNIAGQCCFCNGTQGTYRRAVFSAIVYLCM
jgi:hypothetical protein